MSTTVTATYLVDGIDCDHCVRAVLWELSQIDGLHEIAVDRLRAVVTVTAARRPPDEAAVRGALEEAGCVLRGRLETTAVPRSGGAPGDTYPVARVPTSRRASGSSVAVVARGSEALR